MKVAIVGVGNCACAFVQALHACKEGLWEHTPLVTGLSFPISNLEVVAAFDVDARKIGFPLEEAIFNEPNCTTEYFSPALSGVVVVPGVVADGVSGPLSDVISLAPPAEEQTVPGLVWHLRSTGADCLLIYLPVGAQQAAEMYAQAALDAGCSVVNCTPALLANSTEWRSRVRGSGPDAFR